MWDCMSFSELKYCIYRAELWWELGYLFYELLTFVLFRSLTVLNVQPPSFFFWSKSTSWDIGILSFFFFFSLPYLKTSHQKAKRLIHCFKLTVTSPPKNNKNISEGPRKSQMIFMTHKHALQSMQDKVSIHCSMCVWVRHTLKIDDCIVWQTNHWMN